MFIIPLVIGIVVLAFKLIFADSLINIHDIFLNIADQDKGLEVSKQAMKETARVVSEGVNKFVIIGAFVTAVASVVANYNILISETDLIAKVIGIIGISLIGLIGVILPAIDLNLILDYIYIVASFILN